MRLIGESRARITRRIGLLFSISCFGAGVFGCVERRAPCVLDAPTVLAPLFREPRSDAEKSAIAQLAAALETDHVGLALPRGTIIRANVATRAETSGDQLYAEHGLCVEVGKDQRIVLRQLSGRGRTARLIRESAVPQPFRLPTSGETGQSTSRGELPVPVRVLPGHLLLLAGFPQNQLFDIDSGEWVQVSSGHVLAADANGVYVERDGSLLGPDGAEIKLCRRTPLQMVGQFVIWPDDSIENIRNQKRFETPGVPRLINQRQVAPDGDSLAVVNRYTGQISIWRLGSTTPSYEEIAVPAVQYLWLGNWGSHPNWLIAAIFRNVGEARVLLLIHIPTKTLYQITDGSEENQYIEARLFSYCDEASP